MTRKLSVSGAILLLLLTIHSTNIAEARRLHGAKKSPKKLHAVRAPPPTVAVSADVYNGQPAPAGAFDFAVAMKAWMQDSTTGTLSLQHFCGGSLVSADTVITAAHCLVMEDGSLLPAESLVMEIQGQQYGVASIYVPTGYNPAALGAQNEDFLDNRVDDPASLSPNYDIAAIKLSSASSAPAVALPAADLALTPGQVLEVAGWGLTGSDASLSPSDTLLYASLQYAAPFDFNNPGAEGSCPLPTFSDTVCALDALTGANSCAGDSGGPLIVRDYTTGAATLVGVVSNGPACDQYPFGHYTDVRLYLGDIQAWMA